MVFLSIHLLSSSIYGHVCLMATSRKGEEVKRSSDTTDRSFTPRVHFLLSVEALTMLCFCFELELRARDNRKLQNLDRTGIISLGPHSIGEETTSCRNNEVIISV